MLACDECGAVVDPEMTQVHLDWHADLVKISNLAEGGPVANPNRIRVDENGISYQEC